MTEETVTFEFLAKLVQNSLEEGRKHRVDMLELKQLHVAQYEMMKRMDRRMGEMDRRVGETSLRMSELRDDLELMLKMELGGALTHMQTTIEHSLGRIEDKVDGLATRVEALERKTT